MSSSFSPLVSVGILTYNHDRVICQCLDSILSQETNFRFEVVIGDDASFDSTRNILYDYQKRYPESIKLILHDTNIGISDNYRSVLSSCSGKYLALCEGDDYWTASHKLQLQVDFLEKHIDYGFVGARTMLLFPDGLMKDDNYPHPQRVKQEGYWDLYGKVFEYAKYGPVTRTVSICFRKSIIEPYIQISGSGNDIVLQSILAYNSCFAEYSQPLCVYRQGGVSTDRLSLDKQIYYNSWFVKNRLLQKQLFPIDCDWDELELHDRETFILLKYALKSFHFKKALGYKKMIVSQKYKNKAVYRHLHGLLSCMTMSIAICLKSVLNK